MTSIRHNPLVIRAFRAGFRSGPQSLRIGLWLLALVVIVLGALAFRSFVPNVDDEDLGRILTIGMLWFGTAGFVVGGLQRMLKSFSFERERGTYEFLHLSTLPASSLIWGFLWSGQLPGYLLLGCCLPVLSVGVWLGGFAPLPMLLVLVMLGFYVLFASLLFLKLGFWMKKAADVRGSLFVGAMIFGFMINLISNIGFCKPLGLLAGYSVVRSAWSRAQPLGLSNSVSRWDLGLNLPFFGWSVPIELVAVLFLAPIGVLIFVSLVRCVRDRSRKPISDAGVFVLSVWTQLFVYGFLWGMPIDTATACGVAAMFTMGLAHVQSALSTRSTRIVRQRLSRAPSSVRDMLVGPDAPPYLLAIVTVGVLWVLSVLWISASEPSGAPIWVGALVVLPFLIIVAGRQHLEFLGLQNLRRLVGVVSVLLVWWGPYAGYLILSNTTEVPLTETRAFLRSLALVSPLSQVHFYVDSSAPRSEVDLYASVLFQVVFLALAVLLAHSGYRRIRRLVTWSRAS